MTTQRTPIEALWRGVVAGAVGTLAMDLVWYARYRRGGGTDGFRDWEFSSGIDDWDKAPAPAQVGRRLAEAVLRRPLPVQVAGLTNNVTHWATGIGWGAAFGLATAGRGPAPAHGLVLGPAAWGTSYATLGLAGIYQPIWEYDARTLGKDLSAHLVFGTATALAARALRGRR